MIIAYYEQNRDSLTPEVVPPFLKSVLNAIPTIFNQKLDVPHKAFLAMDDVVIFYYQFRAPVTSLDSMELYEVMNSYNSDSSGVLSLEDQLNLTQLMLDAFRNSIISAQMKDGIY